MTMPSKRQPPRPRDRILGARLRAIRKERTKLSLEDAAKALEWSLATMSRIENGRRRITTEDMATILTVYRIRSAEPYAKVLTKLDHIALPTRESQTMLRSILKEA
jgi:transcriptional regulator with XRE-family HTH domain